MTAPSFIALGVGSGFSTRHYSSCLLVDAGGEYLLVDCPHPVRKMMADAAEKTGEELSPDRIAAVAITHLHADHCSGLEALGFYFHFVLRRRLPVAAHPEVLRRLWDDRLSAGMDRLVPAGGDSPKPMRAEDYFELCPVEENRSGAVGRFRIECRSTRHHIASAAFRVRVGDRCLGYSGDTAFDRGLIDWLLEADLVVHETGEGIHTPYEKLAALPETVRGRMRLIHYPDTLDEGGGIELLREGVRYPI